MRVCFVSRGGIGEFMKNAAAIEAPADLYLCGFQSLGEVSYERELNGETRYFEKVAALSASLRSVVVCGCVTDAKGFKRKSAVVAERGKILGVSDMTNVLDGEVGSGAALRVYETAVGRLGVIVAEDLFFPEVAKALSACGSDFLVCPYTAVSGSVESVLIRAHAFCYGTPVFFCGVGYASVAAADGTVAFASPESPCELSFQGVKEYHLVETRRRGFYKPPKKDF